MENKKDEIGGSDSTDEPTILCRSRCIGSRKIASDKDESGHMKGVEKVGEIA